MSARRRTNAADSGVGRALAGRWWIVVVVAAATVVSAVGLTLLQDDVYRAEPFSPRPLRVGLLALVAGLCIGLATAFVVGRRTAGAGPPGTGAGRPIIDTLTGPADLSRLSPPPRMIAVLPGRRALDRGPSGAYGALADEVQFLGIDGSLSVIQIVGVVAGSGSTACAANLAAGLAAAGVRVTLVDADLVDGSIHRQFGIDNHIGMSDALGGESIDMAAQPIADRLSVITAGPAPDDVLEVLSRPRLGEVIAELRNRGETVILHSPPILSSGGAMTLCSHAAGVIVVAAIGASLEQVTEAHRLLHEVHAPIAGYVLTEPGGMTTHTAIR